MLPQSRPATGARLGDLLSDKELRLLTVRWTHPQWGEVASGSVRADMRGSNGGWLYVRIGNFNQLIALEGQPRRFGGRQWYFVCPRTKRPVSVVWKPDGAEQFCSRQTWG